MVRRSLVVILPLVVGCGTGSPGRARAFVTGGVTDTTHDEVVALALSGGSLCSGVVIAPRVILTAAHCLRGRTAADVTVDFGADLTAPTAQRSVAATQVYPGATGTDADATGGVDLAALFLAADAPAAPAMLHLDPLPADLRFTDVTIVGYGDDGPTGTGSGTRRAATTPIESQCDRLLGLGDDVHNSCTGDSGGPLYLGAEVIALVSYGSQGCQARSFHTRLDVHRAWIESVLDGVPDASCPTCVGPDPTCTVAAPDAGTSGGGGDGCAIWAPGRR